MGAVVAAIAGDAAPMAATEPAMIAATLEYFMSSDPFPRLRFSPPSPWVTTPGRRRNPGSAPRRFSYQLLLGRSIPIVHGDLQKAVRASLA